MEHEVDEDAERSDGQVMAEAVRVGIDVVLTLLCIYVMWGYVKERPEVQERQARLSAWWTKTTTEGRRMKKMENETVFEAIQVVDQGATDAGT